VKPEADSLKQHPRALLDAWGVRPKKRFGQNFLMDGASAQRIAKLALRDYGPHTHVVEIGAGTGALTAALLGAGADVTALEIDTQLVTILQHRADLERAAIIEADAMTVDYRRFAAAGSWIVAGNLPYNIATPLVLMLIEMEDGPQSLTVMLQKDVADRLAARPGTPAYGSLSLAAQYAMEVERSFTLSPRAFYPSPKVESTVVRLRRRPAPPVHPRDVATFRRLIRASFAYRRKTLANSLVLSLGYERSAVCAALRSCDISETTRGEQLDMQAFANLSDALGRCPIHP
jgi:16S rRNA (adenine1518-N6/adenine1519-N6)-dimethyltransferase